MCGSVKGKVKQIHTKKKKEDKSVDKDILKLGKHGFGEGCVFTSNFREHIIKY